MKKWVEKHRDKINLILLTVIGMTVIILTYVKSFIDGMVIEKNSKSFDFSKFGTEYSTYCINSLILYSYVKIIKLQKYKVQRKTEKLSEIDKIHKIILPSNSIPESVKIDCGYVRYDLLYSKYNRKIKQIVILNILVYVCGIIPYIWDQEDKSNFIVIIVQTLDGIFNILYLVLGELKRSEIKFLSIKLSKNIKDCEKKINDKYEEIMTFNIQKECIETYGEQPYYIIQYSKLKNKYDVILELLLVIGIGLIVIYTLYNNFLNVLTAENGLYFTMFPNVVLIIFCIVSNQNYYDKILQHKVTIEEYAKKKIIECREREINKLIYQINITTGKKKYNELYIINIMDMTEWESILERFKKHVLNKLSIGK